MSEISTREDSGFFVVAVAGEVDLSWSADVRRAILDGQKGQRDVLVDLSQVTYIDSSGIAALVEGLQNAKAADSQFALVSVSRAVMSVLELARLDQVFPIHEDAAAAAK